MDHAVITRSGSISLAPAALPNYGNKELDKYSDQSYFDRMRPYMLKPRTGRYVCICMHMRACVFMYADVCVHV